jgi:hypothetical protein
MPEVLEVFHLVLFLLHPARRSMFMWVNSQLRLPVVLMEAERDTAILIQEAVVGQVMLEFHPTILPIEFWLLPVVVEPQIYQLKLAVMVVVIRVVMVLALRVM